MLKKRIISLLLAVFMCLGTTSSFSFVYAENAPGYLIPESGTSTVTVEDNKDLPKTIAFDTNKGGKGIIEKEFKSMDQSLGDCGLYAYGWIKSYFIGWSPSDDYKNDSNAKLFYKTQKVSDVYPDGIPDDAKLHAVFAGYFDVSNKENYIEIDKDMPPYKIIDGNIKSSKDGVIEEKNRKYRLISVWNDPEKEEYNLNLSTDFYLNKLISSIVYTNPGNVLTNGDDNGDKKKTYVDLHVKLDPRLEIDNTLKNVSFTSYEFEPKAVLDDEENVLADISNSAEKNNPKATFSFDRKGNTSFIIRVLVRNRVGGKHGMVTSADNVVKPMKLNLGDANQYRIPKALAEELSKSGEELVMEGYVDGKVDVGRLSSKIEDIISPLLKFKFLNPYVIDYKFEDIKGKTLPQGVMNQLPGNKTLKGGAFTAPDVSTFKTIKVNDGTWKFVEWDKPTINDVTQNTTVTGTWEFEKNPIKPIIPSNPDNNGDTDRIEGNNRIETAVEASKDLYPSGTNAVVLSNCERFTDVLTANPFAIQEKASALLIYEDKIPEKTMAEIERLGAKQIYISGGYQAVSRNVVDKLKNKGYSIYRFDGENRYDTARKIAIKIREKGNKETVELASGENFPDALCMTSMAVKDKAPILLTKKEAIPMYTKKALAEWDIKNINIAGLNEAVSADVEKEISKGFKLDGNSNDAKIIYKGATNVERFGGANRYETSVVIAKNARPGSRLGVYATGENFPDALIAGNYAGRKDAPVLLVKRDTLPEVVEKYTGDSNIDHITVIGGINAVSEHVYELIKEAAK